MGRPLAFLLGIVEYVSSEIRLILISTWLLSDPVLTTVLNKSIVSTGNG